MQSLQFHDQEFSVTHGGETIQFLPKEYALLSFLNQHTNQVFSRLQLLDQVWGMEDPSDRTVDDHIYRLRKKCKGWDHLFFIETVRGSGYRLVSIRSNEGMKTFLSADQEVKASIHSLLHKYHYLGMGEAMQTLALSKDVLGFEMDSFYVNYLRFISGDFKWFVETTTIPFWEKAFYLLHIFASIQFNEVLTRQYFERAIKHKELPKNHRDELAVNIIGIYLRNQQWDLAQSYLKSAEGKAANKEDLCGFDMLLILLHIQIALYTGDMEAAREHTMRGELYLKEQPVQREYGAFLITKGLLEIATGNEIAADKYITKGFDVLKQTKFITHYVNNLHLLLHYLRNYAKAYLHQQKYEKMWHEVAKQYHFSEVEKEILGLFQNLL